jgi:D-glucosaminate-6-phosphate ammonia-lyase
MGANETGAVAPDRVIFAELGTKPVVNARGTYTDLGGSRISTQVWAAMETANRYFADVPDLLVRSGEAIAALVGAEAARVTPGAAAAIALGTAACVTRGERDPISRLPETDSRVVVQRGHRYKYDRCVRMVGVRLEEVDDLAGALAGDVAAVFFPAHLEGAPGTLGLAQACVVAHQADVPVVVDAAYLVDPPQRMSELTATGADLVCFSAKYFGGPNGGGFVCGRSDLVGAVGALDFIRFEAGEEFRYGRPFKLDRHTIVGVYAALRDWLQVDPAFRLEEQRRQVEVLRTRLARLPGLELTPMCFTMQETLEPEPVNCLHVQAGSARVLAADRALREGDPSVLVHVVEDALVVVVDTIGEDDEELLAERLEAALGP